MTEPEPEPGRGWDCHVHVFDAAAAVRAGHYRPQTRALGEIEALAAAHGVGHLVLVQPSVYGSDNTLLLRALAVTPGRHRGVVVIEPDTSDAELDAMHALGVRGVRLNLVSPVGESAGAVVERHAQWSPRLQRRGWHLQWYAAPEHLGQIAALHEAGGVACVLDHLGGLHAELPDTHEAWDAMARLAAAGAWVKLSGWYRLRAQAPYAALLATTRRLRDLFGARLVWGSDWPHTAFAPDALPLYDSTWQPLVEAFGQPQARALRDRVPDLYA